MTTVPYQTQEEAAGIIADHQAKGYILSEVRDHIDGSSLIFLDPGEEAPELPAPAVDPIDDLKAQVADLKKQLDAVKADLTTTKATTEKNAADIASIKTGAGTVVKG